MRILYFSPRECWPLNTGARLRDYHLARELAGRARVTYLGLRSPKDPPAVEPPAACGFARSVLVEMNASYTPGKIVRGLIGPVPVTVLNFWSGRAAVELERLLNGPEHFDTVQMEGVHLIEYLPVVRGSRRPPAIVADWHNIESEILRRYAGTASGLARRLYARRTAQLIENMEMRLLRGCDVHVVPSRRERDKLLARLPGVRIEVVGNGVDVAHHSGDRLMAAGREGFPEVVERRDVLFVGSMDYHANIDAVVEFAAQTWPGILARHPGLRFVVAGRNPPPQVRALAELPQVEVTGTVDDVRPWYRSAIVVVVPLRTGSGTRLKILEAMAAGVPVVSTRLGAEGLDVTDGIDIVLAETALETMNSVDELVRSPERRGAIAAAARELARNHYDWPILGARLLEVHHSVNRSPGSDPAGD
jgi:glycosyltransferase involved in cell wall biosynthesis